jgi:DNA-binding transcriptional regulator YiaG
MLVTEEVITMTRTGVLQEIRQMRFEEIYERRRGGRLTQEEAAEILGVDVRTVSALEQAL